MQTSSRPASHTSGSAPQTPLGGTAHTDPGADHDPDTPSQTVEARLVMILGLTTGFMIGVFFVIYIVLEVVSSPAMSPGQAPQALQLLHGAFSPMA